MLGRLIAGYGKGQTQLESVTEEQHSRSLLWPVNSPSQGHRFPSSPPKTPLGSPTFRAGPFDDRGGLELNEAKDVRIVVAQDAFGSMDKPLLLFDTQKRTNDTQDQKKAGSQESRVPTHQRHRSSTISGNASAWSRPSRDAQTTDRATKLLDCMFGATSTTKTESSTKLHVMSTSSHDTYSFAEGGRVSHDKSATRTPLFRSHTSNQLPSNRNSALAPEHGEDLVLITRMFAVPLPESKEPVSPTMLSDDPLKSHNQVGENPSEPGVGTAKRAKLIEKKVPMYAVGLLFSLPRPDPRSLSRPSSRTSFASFSFPNSLGSELASSWTLLDAIPDSLSSSTRSYKRLEYPTESITGQWDVILRCLAYLEAVSKMEILHVLMMVEREMLTSMVKTPKGPYEQRTNQRNIYIRHPRALSDARILAEACRQTMQRVCTALRIPRVIVGTGLSDGHWLDEIRFLVQTCGSKSHNFFLFNLLTAFLGNHTEWFYKLGIKRSRISRTLSSRRDLAEASLYSRTVIVADQRSMARRLVFVLASFFPTPPSLDASDGLDSHKTSPLPTPNLSLPSPLRRTKVRDNHVSFGTTDVQPLSVSASTTCSMASTSSTRLPRPPISRKDSDSASIRPSSRFPITGSNHHLRKTSTANSTISSQPVTSVPYYTANRDGYFPEVAVMEGNESAASADLARILRRDSSSTAHKRSSGGSWGALLGGFWGKASPNLDGNESTPPLDYVSSPSSTVRRRGDLEGMMHEARMMLPAVGGVKKPGHIDDGDDDSRTQDLLEPKIDKPRLKVDETDGVIDVDVGIPGFLTWNGDEEPYASSVPHRPFTSPTNGAGHRSSRSSFSHQDTWTNERSQSLNVAGYLGRYHEDFSLQAVRPYGELVDEIQQSMLREYRSLQLDTQTDAVEEGAEADLWIPVCSTLVADLCHLSIERISLQRRAVMQGSPSFKNLATSDGAKPEVKFHREAVSEFDTTLADAIENATSPKVASQTPIFKPSQAKFSPKLTRGFAASSFPPVVYPTLTGHSSTPPTGWRSPCGEIVADALQEVVKSVNESLQQQQRSPQSGSQYLTSRQTTGTESPSNENALRKGVRHWLLSSEATSVW